MKSEYEDIFEDYHRLITKRKHIQRMQEGRARELDLLKYQIDEIERASLQPGEEEELRQEHIRTANVEKFHEIHEISVFFRQFFYANDFRYFFDFVSISDFPPKIISNAFPISKV